MKNKICLNCGKVYQLNSNSQRFCSSDCWKEKNKEKLRKKHREYYWKNKEQQKEYREKNKEHYKNYNKKYRQENKEKILERERKNYKKNREKLLQRMKEYRNRNKEKIKEIKRKDYQKNKNKILKKAKKYREIYPDRTIAQRLARKEIEIPQGQICEICNINLAKERHHPDYSKPLEVKFLCIPCHKAVTLKYEI